MYLQLYVLLQIDRSSTTHDREGINVENVRAACKFLPYAVPPSRFFATARSEFQSCGINGVTQYWKSNDIQGMKLCSKIPTF
jgi:hypothetical protein